jgi:hypothetical protein
MAFPKVMGIQSESVIGFEESARSEEERDDNQRLSC